VKGGQITTLEQIYLHSIPIKEYQIVDTCVLNAGGKLEDEVMQIMPTQKQTTAGQRTRFKCYVVVGDKMGHVGLGWKSAAEVATAIRGGIIAAKLNTVPIRRGFWGSRMGKPHTIPAKLNGKCGSVRVRLIPAPRGTNIVAAPASKRILEMAGLDDCYTSSRGATRTKGNFLKATFFAVVKSYGYLTPDLWSTAGGEKHPFQEHTDFLQNNKGRKSKLVQQ
jgi:small subunit ribosomal protein S2e